MDAKRLQAIRDRVASRAADLLIAGVKRGDGLTPDVIQLACEEAALEDLILYGDSAVSEPVGLIRGGHVRRIR